MNKFVVSLDRAKMRELVQDTLKGAPSSISLLNTADQPMLVDLCVHYMESCAAALSEHVERALPAMRTESGKASLAPMFATFGGVVHGQIIDYIAAEALAQVLGAVGNDGRGRPN